MKSIRLIPCALVATLLTANALAQQGQSIAQSRHNLSAGGPGGFRAQSQGDLCIFCHAPHKATTQTPLWNRLDPVTTYLTYQSSTFQGTVSQPNGTTKLCLSCHDGTIALGRVVSLSQEIPMLPGSQFLNSGPGYLGSNLRDDHPVSFPYSTSRGGSGLDYRQAAAIPPPVHLDPDGNVQCTSCHDPHNNQHGYFLHATDRQSVLCLSCHAPTNWTGSAHELSTATWNGTGQNPWPDSRYQNVRDFGCRSCHKEHGAGTPQRLMRFALEEDNCLRCHNGTVAAKNIQTDIAKISAHSPTMTVGIHDPTENPLSMPRHAECQDCHNPHQAKVGGYGQSVSGPLTGVSGINTSGTVVPTISANYELCYKCHADNPGSTSYVPRQFLQLNTRLEFDPGNPSFHPIEAAGRSTDVPSLLPPWTTASRMDCTDCHTSNTSPTFGGGGARGPHGSTYRPILGARYDTTDNISESPAAYALCYKCHNRSSILGNVTFREHNKHIVGERAPCSVCHDAHGISSGQGNATNNSRLINFNTSIVRPYNGVIRFTDLGNRRGSCILICHGETHNNLGY